VAPATPAAHREPWADSSFDLAQGLVVVELPVEVAPSPAPIHAAQPSTLEQQMAWNLGDDARGAGRPRSSSPYPEGSELARFWHAGYDALS
jgi:hypothetical protein